ncbi:ferritin-like domain-containing protein [Desulfonatronum lacustre]|uniref:ferritin-like domain-containing protein n=1 Tax=Desulfonatronum lacustre TaxID=66849 RepID=UPI00048D242D|nr:ferritin family protein [Desulfonatronum lacustre]SMP40339.1 Rubrerythrin [Desulfonatronum zhilinae]
MAEFFQAAEIAEAAVTIEQQGQAFYISAAQAAKNPDVKDFFLYFAKEEARHEQIFQQLKDRLGKFELPAWSTTEEYGMYLKALIDSHSIFSPELQRRLAEATSENEAIRLAMGFEKDTILFFMEMKELVPDTEKKFVMQCIDEERSHLRQLSKMLT